MVQYKRFLKLLLVVNCLCICFVAFVGFRQNQQDINNISPIEESKALTTIGTTKSQVIPGGQTVGIYINTEGILVIDTGEVTDMNGKKSAPARNKLKSGDYIKALNGEKMVTKKQLVDSITNCQGKDLIFTVNRDGNPIDIKVIPVETGANEFKVGIWVRDDLQGLGTITYVDGDTFGALGHSITDMDTGEKMDVSGGAIYQADIFGVEKGESGKPGEIEGMISYQTENIVGEIDNNEIYGIYGHITEGYKQSLSGCETCEVAAMEEVQKGKAYIQSYVDGKKTQYEIEIVNIHKNENGDPEMEILVTDEALISLTGGIVQGMSGSPILQNGKMIGAVTHVFVDDPKRGYGIFIEKMME